MSTIPLSRRATIEVQRNLMRGTFQLLVAERDTRGDPMAVGLPLTVQRLPDDPAARFNMDPPLDPTMEVRAETLQALVDELARAGFMPSAAAGSVGQLAAVQAHLAFAMETAGHWRDQVAQVHARAADAMRAAGQHAATLADTLRGQQRDLVGAVDALADAVDAKVAALDATHGEHLQASAATAQRLANEMRTASEATAQALATEMRTLFAGLRALADAMRNDRNQALVLSRDEAREIARRAALAYSATGPLAYLPDTPEQAATWWPHEWVLDAIQMADRRGMPADPRPAPIPPYDRPADER